MTTTEIQAEIIVKQDEIIEHYKTFYDSIKHPLVVKITKRWEEYGNEIESELADLNKQLKQSEVESEVAEIKSTPIPSGWICPRCQKVHSWMVQSCDCYPSVITASTTEPIKELAEIIGEASCNNCKYQDTCNENSDDECKWEPIK